MRMRRCLKREYNLQDFDLMKRLEVMKRNGVALKRSLNRPLEPIVCSPTGAFDMIYRWDMDFLIMEDILVVEK
tara:strand:- start:260 stop:478 length:219 start_codon:yes stop_codon:yes gene_type:complete